MDHDNLSKVDQFKLLTETAAGTPMGTLLRKFWHPIAVAEQLEKGKAQALRVLGEDLTLYRGMSGRPYLIGGRCAHRCTVLHTGVIQGEQIRCMYHGWRYDGSGLCTDIPAEKQPRSRPIRIPGYPVHEYSGVVFAYLGGEPVPTFDLPRKEILEAKGRSTLVHKSVWDCNWFQHVENSLDAVHVSFAHLWGSVGAIRIVGDRLNSGTLVFGDERRHPTGRNASEQQRPDQRLDVPQQQSRGGAGTRKRRPVGSRQRLANAGRRLQYDALRDCVARD